MTKRILPDKKQGYIEKPLYTLSTEEREIKVKELLENAKVISTPVETRRKILNELRGN
jgi:hypothetical protein